MALELATIHTAFYEMEVAEGLFDRQSDDGLFYWDIVRYAVFMGLQAEYGGPFKIPVSSRRSSTLAGVKNAAKALLNRFTQAYLVSEQPQYLFYTLQRTLQGSRLIDTLCDPLLDLLAGKSVAIEAFNRESISLWSMLLRRPTRVPTVFVPDPPRHPPARGVAAAIAESVGKYFDRSPDIPSLIREPLSDYEEYRAHFDAVFGRHRPKAVILVNNGPLKGLFAAAREHDVPTFEIQHGTPSVQSPFWSYPLEITSAHPGVTLPTAYLVFSEYFKSLVHFPVAHTCAIGNEYLHQAPVANTSDAIAIISAYMYQDDLVGLAVALAQSFPARSIFFRLHPHQFSQKGVIAEQMRHCANIVVQTDEMSLGQLFAACTFVIGVHSTVLYSALQARKKVMVYRIANYFSLQDILPFVETFDTAADAERLIRDHASRFRHVGSAPTFFAPLDRQAFLSFVASVTGPISGDQTAQR